MKIALLGYGTVGTGVAAILDNRANQTGMTITKIFGRKSQETIIGPRFTDDFETILADAKIDCVIEVLGGLEPAYTFIHQALEAGKHVVTANKEVVCIYLDELTTLAQKHGVQFHYDASVGGGIPIIQTLLMHQKFNQAHRIDGILNGTTNFILSHLETGSIDFAAAVKLAQDHGFAESDPTADLKGLDLMRKIRILCQCAFGSDIAEEDIIFRGIDGIKAEHIAEANRRNAVFKLVATAIVDAQGLQVRCEPVLVSKNHLFSNIREEHNMLSIQTEYDKTLTFSGPGAGSRPTAAAIVADCLLIQQNTGYQKPMNKKKLPVTHGCQHQFLLFKDDTVSIGNATESELAAADFYARIEEVFGL